MIPDRLPDIHACVFDAYGTLFDVNSAAVRCRDRLGERWERLAEVWRAKQLQYTWLRSLMKAHADFWQVTGDALDYALASLELSDSDLRRRLMEMYLRLEAYPEVKETLDRLQAGGLKLAVLSNGTPRMLDAAVTSAGIGRRLDAVLSVERVGVFKPDPAVYGMASEQIGFPVQQMCFVSSNAWDAHAAKAYGYRVVWCNRFAQAEERIPERPDREITNLAALPGIVLPEANLGRC